MASSNTVEDLCLSLAAHQLFIWWQIDGENQHQNHTRGDAIRAVGFSVEESKNRTLQQKVRCAAIQLKEGAPNPSLPATIEVSVSKDTAATSPMSSGASTSSASSKSALTKVSRTYTLPGNCRLTSKQKQAACMLSFKTAEDTTSFHKLATSTVHLAKTKGDKRGTERILQELADKKGIPRNAMPSDRTVNHYIQTGRAGKTPSKKGRPGIIEAEDYASLGLATLAFTELSAANGNEQTMRDLVKVVITLQDPRMEMKKHNSNTSLSTESFAIF